MAPRVCLGWLRDQGRLLCHCQEAAVGRGGLDHGPPSPLGCVLSFSSPGSPPGRWAAGHREPVIALGKGCVGWLVTRRGPPGCWAQGPRPLQPIPSYGPGRCPCPEGAGEGGCPEGPVPTSSQGSVPRCCRCVCAALIRCEQILAPGCRAGKEWI